MEINLVLSFILASALLTLMPGPDSLFVITESLTKGKRNGIAVSLGLSSGILIHTLAAATGLSIIIQKSAIAFSILKYLGAAYLLYLAFLAIKEKNDTLAIITKKEEKEKPFFDLLRKGFMMNVLNPKVSLFFIAFLPQFVSKRGYSYAFQMIILGFIFMIQAVIIFCSLSIVASKLKESLQNSKYTIAMKWSKVGIYSILGMLLALSKR
jgi:threonine/homoserine/homoserine lactone efflux protein